MFRIVPFWRQLNSSGVDMWKREMPLISLLMFFLLLRADLIDGSLKGTDKICQVEGEPMTFPGITEDPCITCHCRSGKVECQMKVCSALDGCRATVFDQSRHTCCGVCKGCNVNGTLYPSGAQWTHPDDPCKRFICEAGILTVSRDKCLMDCTNPIYTPGQCCPSCAGCKYDVTDRLNGEVFLLSGFAEIQCTCNEGQVTCAYRACPVLNCPEAAQYMPKDETCPRCKGSRRAFDLRTSCFFSGIIVSHGAVIQPDNCTSCACLRGSIVCQREVCSRPPCDVGQYTFRRRSCCPRCSEQRSCEHNSKTYQSGSQWLSDACMRCRCDDGIIYCGRQPCLTRQECPEGRFLKELPDSCCPQCVKDWNAGGKKQQHPQRNRHQRPPHKKKKSKKIRKTEVNGTSVTPFAEEKRQ